MTTGELIKILADYCPDTPVEVTMVEVDRVGAGGMYTIYDDQDETLYIRWATRKEQA